MPHSILKLNRPLVLATASEARRKLVSDIGLDFLADTVEIDETPKPGETISEYVTRLALAKADAVVPPSLDAIIITVDTAIGINDKIIGKPDDESNARRILQDLSGHTHEVLSVIAVRTVSEASIETELTRTEVEFDDLSREMISWYISTGEWKNRAGAYAIQGKGMSLVREVRGCLTNVIGISIPSLLRILKSVNQ